MNDIFLSSQSYSFVKKDFLFLIPAHNEEKVIGDTLKSIKDLDYSKDKFDVVIIADNCTDNTCEIVKNEGFSCFIKNDGEAKSKAYALKWFLGNFKELSMMTENLPKGEFVFILKRR